MITKVTILAMVLFAFSVNARITPDQARQLPAPAPHKIDFTKEIKPILEKSCVNCHGHGRSKGGFRVDDRETFLKGGDSGTPIVIGKSHESLLIELVMGFDPDQVMPAKGSRLKPEQIGLLRAWIDQGAVWDKSVWLGKTDAQNLKPRHPEIPNHPSFSNPVDAFVDSYFSAKKIKWPQPVNDRVFARRVYLDIVGLLPSPAELEHFVADPSQQKRERLVEKLLNENRAYAEHWLTFWNDMLRNDYKGAGYIDGGRKQITQWLFSALETNKPYDRFVAELINPNSGSEGFTKGIVWRGVVNASQTPPMQAAQTISQVFMGLNLKCASCHDSFVNDWQLADAYALANVYSDEPLELFLCDKPTGKKAGTRFLYPEFGEVDPAANKPERLKQLAACVVNPENGRLSRTLVNRFWGRFMGHALVESVDDMEKAAWNPDILDWLAEDFVAHNYDMKHLIKQIVTSRAYQLPSVNAGENDKEYVFHGPTVRRLTAEQFRDALTTLTGVGYSKPAVELDSATRKTGESFKTRVEPKWIWNSPGAEIKAKAQIVYFRKNLELPSAPADAIALLSCDNVFTLFVNGQKVASGNDFTSPAVVNIRKFLQKGTNVIAIEAINNLPGNQTPTAENAKPGTENPAGLFFFARIQLNENGAQKNLDFGSDQSWTWSAEKREGWEKNRNLAADWARAVELGEISMQPWRLRKNIIAQNFSETPPGKVRASLVAADSLMVALGRPNREQVVTTRPVEATTLQALEMTNGKTLSEILKQGAENLVQTQEVNRDLIQRIYAQALGRKPSASEIQLAQQVIGTPAKKEGVEDFLWAMTMLPEFQLIY